MPVLNGECYVAVGSTSDVPGEGSPEPSESNVALWVGRDDLVDQIVPSRFSVGPVHEVVNSQAHWCHDDRSGVAGFASGIVRVGVEEQLAGADHPFQHADGGDDRLDGDPGHVAFYTAGNMVAVFVDRGFVFAGADQVSRGNSVSVGYGVGTQLPNSATGTFGGHG